MADGGDVGRRLLGLGPIRACHLDCGRGRARPGARKRFARKPQVRPDGDVGGTKPRRWSLAEGARGAGGGRRFVAGGPETRRVARQAGDARSFDDPVAGMDSWYGTGSSGLAFAARYLCGRTGPGVPGVLHLAAPRHPEIQTAACDRRCVRSGNRLGRVLLPTGRRCAPAGRNSGIDPDW